MRILLATNTLTQVQQPAYANHCQMWFRLGRKTKHDFLLLAPWRMGIDRMRNLAAKTALETGCDRVLFVDDDVLVPIALINEFLENPAPIVAGWVKVRDERGRDMAFEMHDGMLRHMDVAARLAEKPESPIIPCAAVGFSLCSISVELFRQMPAPWFVTGPNFTEDVYFCAQLLEQFPDRRFCEIDTRMRCGHLGEPAIYHPDTHPCFSVEDKPADRAEDWDGILATAPFFVEATNGQV